MWICVYLNQGKGNTKLVERKEGNKLNTPKKNKTYYMELEVIELLKQYNIKTGIKQSEAVNRIVKEYLTKELLVK